LLHAAFKDVAHTEVTGHVADLDGLPLVGEDRIPGDDEQPRQLRESGDEVLGDSVVEVLV